MRIWRHLALAGVASFALIATGAVAQDVAHNQTPALQPWPYPPPDPAEWWSADWPPPPEAADPLGDRRLPRSGPLDVKTPIDPTLYRLCRPRWCGGARRYSRCGGGPPTACSRPSSA